MAFAGSRMKTAPGSGTPDGAPSLPHTPDGCRHVEVVDDNNRPLAYISPELVREHQLRHRATALRIFSRNGKLVLTKKRVPAWNREIWGVPYTRLTAPFEAEHHIAHRLFSASMGTPPLVVYRKAVLDLPGEHGTVVLTLFSCGRNRPLLLDDSHLPVDTDELGELVREFPDMLSPMTRQLWHHGLRSFME